jgi:hypothetical protein
VSWSTRSTRCNIVDHIHAPTAQARQRGRGLALDQKRSQAVRRQDVKGTSDKRASVDDSINKDTRHKATIDKSADGPRRAGKGAFGKDVAGPDEPIKARGNHTPLYRRSVALAETEAHIEIAHRDGLIAGNHIYTVSAIRLVGKVCAFEVERRFGIMCVDALSSRVASPSAERIDSH